MYQKSYLLLYVFTHRDTEKKEKQSGSRHSSAGWNPSLFHSAVGLPLFIGLPTLLCIVIPAQAGIQFF
jgi:hypothetical protein